MELEEQLARVYAGRKSEAAGSAARYRDASRQRLRRIMVRKTTTSFIGAVAAFEKHFGHLWGHGKHLSLLSADEAAWRMLWEACRNDVLNNGNNQVRAVESEVAQYEVTWNRHSVTIPATDVEPNSHTN